jgi:hypothetical protein
MIKNDTNAEAPMLPMLPIFFLFAGDQYYPSGGMNDFIDQFDNIDDAIGVGRSGKYDWYNIATIQNDELVTVTSGGN